MNKEGFLVVLRHPEDSSSSRNPQYKGIDRLPPYSPHEQFKQEALEDYVFGKYKDEAGLINDLSLAQELLARIKNPTQEFEVIYVRQYKEACEINWEPGFRFLGYDVAGHSPFWSIVGDLPPEAESTFSERLNEFGLFDSSKEASTYLETYRSKWLTDPSLELIVWEIYLAMENEE